MRGSLGVFAKDAEDLALNADIRGRCEDGSHFSIRGLKPDHAALSVEALKSSVGTIDESDDNFAFPRGSGTFHEDVVSGDDVLVAHRVAANFKCEDLAVADDIAERDAFRCFNGFDWLACSDAPHQWETVRASSRTAWRQHVNRAAAIVCALQKTFVLQVGDVFVDGGKRAEPEAAGDLLIRRGVPVLLSEAGEKIENLFLPPCNCHAGIVANKKRIARYFLGAAEIAQGMVSQNGPIPVLKT